MKILHIVVLVFLVCAAGILLFAGGNGLWQGTEEEEYPYPISFLLTEVVENPDASYQIISLTEADRTVYPVLISALENGNRYLNIHPEGGVMTPAEYYAIDSFAWESYVSFNGVLYRVAVGPIGLAPPVP